eukprot:333750_1
MNKQTRIDSTSIHYHHPQQLQQNYHNQRMIIHHLIIMIMIENTDNRQLHQCKIVDRKININNISYLIHFEGWILHLVSIKIMIIVFKHMYTGGYGQWKGKGQW